MDVPSIFDFNECNRLLGIASQMVDDEDITEVKGLFNACSSITFGGRVMNHSRTLRYCHHLGFVSIQRGTRRNCIKFTQFGKEFLNNNPELNYEITNEQKDFIATKIILNGPWKSKVRGFLQTFSPNYSEITFESNVRENPPLKKSNAISHLLTHLNVIQKSNDILKVRPDYVVVVRDLRAIQKGQSEEDLEEALRLNMAQADQAEDAIVEYERKRLTTMGRTVEAGLVRRISKLNTHAGYDIESFDGDKPLVDYDRFIEVKSSQEDNLRFYFTANEHQIATTKANKYWIYFVGGLNRKRATEVIPVLISNPVNRLMPLPEVNVQVSTYLIEQIRDITLTELKFGNMKGRLL